mgnify:CR=1 FL=1
MDENINVVEDTTNEEAATNDVENEFKSKVENVVEQIRTQALLLGARSMCVTIANMIDGDINKPGKRSMADMRRIVKKVRDFCQTAINHTVETPNFGEEEEKVDE